MSVKLTFQSPKTIVLGPTPTLVLDEIVVNSIVDYPEQKRVFVNIDQLGSVIIWEGVEYDAIGQWTDSDVIARLEQMYGDNGTALA